MKEKRFITIIIALCFLSSLAAITFSPVTVSASSGKPIALKFAHQNPPKGRTTVKLIDAYINKLREVSKGRLDISVYPAQSLIKSREMVTGIETGIADMAWTPLGYFTGRFPLTTVTMLPFMALNTGGKNSLVLQELFETLPEVQKEYRSVKVLSLHASDAYHVFTSKEPVKSMDDLKGLKLRIMGAYPIMASKKLGLSPLFMPMPGIYEAGEKGVLDGAALPWAAVATFNLYEVFPQWTDVDLWSAPFMIFMNKDKWNSLPKDLQDAISSISGINAAQWLGDAAWGPDVKDDTLAKAQKAGKKLEMHSLNPGELERWQKTAGQPVWDEWVKEMNKKRLPGQKVLDAAKQLMEKYK
jgi:TRAP-type C4-dicarboxylate transport system substrate-binding protein